MRANIIQRIRQAIAARRCLAVTRSGFVGLVPNYVEVGDLICAFAGGSVLYTIRYTSLGPQFYSFFGETYLHGLMDGEWRGMDNIASPSWIRLV